MVVVLCERRAGFRPTIRTIITVLLVAAACPATLVEGLRVVNFKVPGLAIYGADVELDCPFSIHYGGKLYSVKWYQNADEFYRYLFADVPPVTVYQRPGIVVDVSCWPIFPSTL